MPTSRRFWRADIEAVPPVERRLALYAMRLLESSPGLKQRLARTDVLVAFWQLLRPVMNPHTVAGLMALADDQEADDTHWEWDEEPVELGMGSQARELMRHHFAAIPRAVIKRLAKADVGVTLSPTLALLGAELALDDPTLRVLDLLDLRLQSDPLRVLMVRLGRSSARHNRALLAKLVDVPHATLRATLSRSTPLRALGLVEYQDDQSDMEDFVYPTELLREVLDAEPADGEILLTLLIEPAPPAAWPLDAFPHLATEGAHLSEVLGEAARTAVPGVNALLYGPPGTGKTELARAVAARCGLESYQVRSADTGAGGLDRKGRLSAYLLAQRLLARRRNALLIFDEVEDVFDTGTSLLAVLRGGAVTGHQKGWMNRILEENPVPAIWLTNRTDAMDPAFLRRFLVPVPLITPPRSVRRQMAEWHLGEAGVASDLLDELAADRMLAPAQLAAARRLLDLRPGTRPATAVREGVGALRTLLHGAPAPQRREPATAFDVAYLNLAGGLSPSAIVRALQREERGSLCFYGPPGTGKTAFAELLAEALDRELVARQASDLLSPYIGETEQNLAKLFRDCDPRHTVLVLDEVDSFLADRRQAQRSWERTQVNELLQQMERFPGIFIAATNLMTGIDAAALRRFDFKLQFRALTATQRVALFAREALGDAEAEVPALLVRHLERLEGLTPGDFATVCRQQRLFGEPFDPEQFLRRLAAEWQLKDSGIARVA